MSDYRSSQQASDEAMFRRLIRRCTLSPTDRLILERLVSLWFCHIAAGFIHPGRTKLAKDAKVHINTVKNTLRRFREKGLIAAVDRVNGGGHFATRYFVNLGEILLFCGQKYPRIDDRAQLQLVDKSVHKSVNNIQTVPVDKTRGQQADKNCPRSCDAAEHTSPSRFLTEGEVWLHGWNPSDEVSQ